VADNKPIDLDPAPTWNDKTLASDRSLSPAKSCVVAAATRGRAFSQLFVGEWVRARGGSGARLRQRQSSQVATTQMQLRVIGSASLIRNATFAAWLACLACLACLALVSTCLTGPATARAAGPTAAPQHLLTDQDRKASDEQTAVAAGNDPQESNLQDQQQDQPEEQADEALEDQPPSESDEKNLIGEDAFSTPDDGGMRRRLVNQSIRQYESRLRAVRAMKLVVFVVSVLTGMVVAISLIRINHLTHGRYMGRLLWIALLLIPSCLLVGAIVASQGHWWAEMY